VSGLGLISGGAIPTGGGVPARPQTGFEMDGGEGERSELNELARFLLPPSYFIVAKQQRSSKWDSCPEAVGSHMPSAVAKNSDEVRRSEGGSHQGAKRDPTLMSPCYLSSFKGALSRSSHKHGPADSEHERRALF